MHPLNNSSQVTEAPATKPRVGSPGYFAESNENGAPSYPGADWFNANIKEFMNALAAAGVEFYPDRFDHLAQVLTANGSQMAPYRADRTYKQNETCTTFDPDTGELQIWTSYAPSDNVGHNPQDPANRHDDWANFPTPCWWIKSHAVEPGTPVYWFSDDIPENALQVMDADIDAEFYHRIAKAYPSLVADGKINLAQILGRYIRIADGGDYIVNTTHEDGIRNIEATASFDTASNVQGLVGTTGGAFSADGVLPSIHNVASGSVTRNQYLNFDASNVVPTADQNQPQSAMANLIIFI